MPPPAEFRGLSSFWGGEWQLTCSWNVTCLLSCLLTLVTEFILQTKTLFPFHSPKGNVSSVGQMPLLQGT